MASVVIWILLFMTCLSSLPILSKNLVAFCCTASLVPKENVDISRFYLEDNVNFITFAK